LFVNRLLKMSVTRTFSVTSLHRVFWWYSIT